MKLLVNGKWKNQEFMTGVQRYAHELINAFDIHDTAFTLAEPGVSNKSKQLIWEQLFLPLKSKGFDTLFCPSNMAPLFLPQRVRLVTTIHCLRYYFHAKSYSPAFVAWYRFAIPKIIERSSIILTVSRTMADQIVQIYPAATGKVRVVYPGVSEHFTQAKHQALASSQNSYWLFIGNASPAKNLLVVLEALARRESNLPLVVLGVSKTEISEIYQHHPHISNYAYRIQALGHVNDSSKVASIMYNSKALLAPSLYESFNLPIAEAMACGTPVIASDTDVHREIGGNAPLFVPATCPDTWSTAMNNLETNNELYEQMQSDGLECVRRYDWNVAAKAIFDILECGH